MTARARLLLVGCLLGTTLVPLSANDGHDGPAPAREPSAIGHPPPAPGEPFKLTVDAIMDGPTLVGYPPSGLRWSGDSQSLYFEQRLPGEDEAATWVVGRTGGTPRRLSDEERKLAPPVNGVWDKARRRVLGVQDGDIVLIDTVAHTRRLLTKTVAPESNPRWTRHETAVTFTRDNALFLMPLAADGDGLVQITDAGPKKQEPKLTESQKFVKTEEETLITYVKEQARKQKKNEDKKQREDLPHLDLTDRQSAPDWLLAHDEGYAYALVVERAQGSKRAEVPNYVSISGYTEEIQSRPKVGDAQDTRRVAIVNLKTKKQVFATLAIEGQSQPAPQTTEPKGDEEDAAADEMPGDASTQQRRRQQQQSSAGTTDAAGDAQPSAAADKADKPEKKSGRELRWSMPVLSRDGKHVVASVRSQDNKDWWLVALDPENGKSRVLDHVHDDAWVRSGGDFGGGLSGWLPDNQHFWFIAEHDGWMHLYAVDAVSESAAGPTQLTNGKFEISNVDLSPDEQSFYLTSTEAHPGERHLYRMALNGGARTKITPTVGNSAAEVSPDGQMLGVIFSASAKPPEVYLMPNKPGAEMTQVTTSTSASWRSYKWIAPELVQVPARDGAQVYARLYTPEMVGAKRHPSAPAVLFVHGAGYLQNAHRYWSSYYREYMFNHLLASRGYVVLDMDYRASAGYGREWRTAIYRHMGGQDLDDIVDGANWLVKTQKVNAKHIGLYGGSYGGFITLMAMFTQPDVFAAGAALRPVTDWAHYNHPYTSNILNDPQNDADAYRQSSPIYFADRLKGALLICHGMVDTNVHFQDTVRLVQRLIELRKENWELAVFPVEDHGFEQDTSWADEYKRILKLFEQNLKKS
jgi:dipeptidyl aminopeptidase/acylaminoacyl peptidase